MIDSDTILYSYLFLFLLVWARTAGLLWYMPVLGMKEIPGLARWFGSFAFAIVLFPLIVMEPVVLPKHLLAASLLLGREFLIGFFLSAALLFFFAALQMAGDFIGRIGGLSISSLFDPATGEHAVISSQFLWYLGVAVFVLLGGIEAVLSGFMNSFQAIPLGAGSIEWNANFQMLLSILIVATELAIQLAAPVMVAVLTVFLVVGILGRAVPQINSMSIGFSANTLLMLAVFCMSLGFGIRCFATRLESVLQTVFAG